ncbi:MAG: phytanoyl-CoA dioxygenase [Gammaproteobacteria bacterium]|nr:phytanoyl-CoA dioxygenase [Gammaproteobacteria bacterium]MBT5681890.1 phytanoyl-CoA dioxygenase [Gammaproteobacteria bacterium]MBT6025870.1 phytanoyl-CoA dioxygenase [Gammaproteobacteria bacterium]MBT6559484.1 phytanoyl-CoA dioxygenase [Gammaproteobacteria bacterium]
MQAYQQAGTERALAMDNRGPVRFTSSGELHPDILESYTRHGFYILTGVMSEAELADLEADVQDMWERGPVTKGAEVDAQGRPALGHDCHSRNLSWVRPLSDPLGGTAHSNGRHPAKMIEPDAPDGAPKHVLQLVLGSLQFSQACLRAYGHPDLLRVAAGINGDDFVPFNEAVWVKHPRLGGSVAWHQDAFTHWQSPDLDAHTHGFNFMAQLYGSNAANGLWVLPGSHVQGKVDIKAMVDEVGSDRLPDAVPVICAPGDVAICNRQAIHGSFANTSDDMRVTINMGFHRRASVLDVFGGGVHNDPEQYTAERIDHRARLISYGIDARSQRFPDETPYVYQPLADVGYHWNAEAQEDLKDYNLEDLGI